MLAAAAGLVMLVGGCGDELTTASATGPDAASDASAVERSEQAAAQRAAAERAADQAAAEQAAAEQAADEAAEEAAAEEEPSGCDPNYSGCVPIASDVDCAGGSGNGPAYASGPIRVIGQDIYDLDNDGDGIACDS